MIFTRAGGVAIILGASLFFHPLAVPDAVSAESPYFRFKAAGDEADAGALRVTGPAGTYYARSGRKPMVPAPSASSPGATWSLVVPVAGMAVDPGTGAITRPPDEPGTYAVRLRATLADGTGKPQVAETAAFTLITFGLPVGLSYPESTTVPNGAATRIYPASAANLSPAAAYDLVEGPSWLSLRADATLSGTPTAPSGAATVRVRVRDFDGETVTSAPFTVAVSGAFASIGARDLSDAVLDTPASMSFEPRVGLTKPITYTLASGRLPDGLQVDADNDRIAGRPREAGTFPGVAFMARDANGISVPTPVFSVTVARPALSYANRAVVLGETFELLPTQSHLAGATYAIAPPLPPGQGMDVRTGRISGLMDASEPRTYVVTATTPWTTVPSAPFVLSGTTRGFSVDRSTSLVSAHVGYPVSLSYDASVSPVTWTPGGTGLPDGLTLDPSSGKVAGIVNEAGTVAGTTAVAKTPAGQSVESGPVTYDILPKPTVANREAYFARVGQPFDEALGASYLIGQGSYSLEGKLPPGLSLAPSGRIQGTPTDVTTATGLVAVVTDAHDGASGRGAPFSVTVTDPGSALAVEGVQDSYRVRVGNALATPVPRAANAAAVPRWSMDPAAAALPTGLAVDEATGVISGIPTVEGTSSGHVLRVADGTRPGYARSLPFSIVAAPALAVAGIEDAYTVKVASPLSLDPVARGVLGSVTWELAGGTLPRALSFDPGSGQVAGAPLIVGTLPDGTPQPQRLAVQSSGAPAGSGYYLRARDSFDGALASSRRFAINVQPGLVVMGPNRYRATVGAAFSSAGTMFATGASGPVGWTLAGEDRPGWLAFDGQTGVMSGVPTAAGTLRGLRLVARSGTDTGTSAAFEIEVAGGLKASAPATVRAHVGKSWKWMTPTANGAVGAVTWSVAAGNLPPGMAMNPSNGTVSGTPTVQGTFGNVRLRATDASGQQGVTDDIAFVIGDGIVWELTDNANFSGRMGTYVAINKPPVIRGAIGKVTYSRNPAVANPCLFSGCTAETASVDPRTGIIRYLMQPANRYGNNVTGGSFLATDEAGATASSPYYMGFRSMDDLNFYDCYSFGRREGYCWSDAVSGVSYSSEAAIENYYGPLKWEIVPGGDAPEWLSVDQATGRVWGTPPREGIVYYTLRVTDTDGQVRSSARAIDVRKGFTPPATGRDFYNVRFGTYRDWRPLIPTPAGDFENVNASWKRKEYREGALDTWVGDQGLNALTSAGVGIGEYFDNNIKALDRQGKILVDYTYDLRVNPPLTIYYTSQDACIRIGENLSLTGPRVSGKVGNITFGNDKGGPANLPEWMRLDTSTGGITGTPTLGSHIGTSYNYLYAKDDADGYVTQTYVGYTVTVHDRLSVTPPSREVLDSLKTGEYAQVRFAVTGANYSDTLSLVGGELPPGIGISQASLAGYPEKPGTYVARLSWNPNTCGSPPIEFDVTLTVNQVERTYGTMPHTVYFREGVYGQSSAPVIGSSTQGTYTWQASGSLYGPASGLRVDAGSGFLYGTPAKAGILDGFQLYAYAPSQPSFFTNRFKIVVTSKPGVTLPDAAAAHVGSGFNLSPGATDFIGPVAWSLSGTLPPGLTFDGRTGAIGGSPIAAGTYPDIVVTGTETEAPTDANGVIQARQAASSRPVTITVTTGPAIGGVADVVGKVGEPASMRPTVTGLVGAPRWALVGNVPEGTLTLDRDTGELSGTPDVPADATVSLLVIDRATNVTATSQPFRVRIAGTPPASTWRWGEQVCTYGCSASGCSGRQLQTCDGPGCTSAARGCDAPFLGTASGTSFPVGQEANACAGATLAPNERYCPAPTAQWLYWPTFYQTKNTAGFIVVHYQLGCFLPAGKTDDSACGTAPTTVSTCRMNGLGYGWCDPAVRYTDNMAYNGYSNEAGWYD